MTTTFPFTATYPVQFADVASTTAPGSSNTGMPSSGAQASSTASSAAPTPSNGAGALKVVGTVGAAAVLLNSLAYLF
jgi:hypothetical protein